MRASQLVMTRWIFIGTMAFGLGVLTLTINFHSSLFSGIDQDRTRSVNHLTKPLLIYFKLTHAKKNPRYDIGVFGNSRVLPLGEKHLGYGNNKFFNFAIHGESIYFSVAMMLWELSKMDKVPKTILIGL